MPPKSFICSICGNTVSKPKSYVLPNGTRACRVHDEVITSHNEAMAAIKRFQQEQREKDLKQKEREQQQEKLRTTPLATKCTCACCKTNGMPSQLYYQKMLKISLSTDGTSATFEKLPQEIKDLYNHLQETKPIFVCDIPEKYRHRITDKFWKMVMGDTVAPLCPVCKKQMGIEDKLPPLENLSLLGSIVESLGKDKEFVDSL
jgi:hypothetical protein